MQAITGLDSKTYTRQQLQKLQERGVKIAGYVWCFPNSDVASRLKLLDGFRLESLWLDVEQPVTVAQVNRDLALCDAYMGRKVGIYSGRWFFIEMRWHTQAYWADRELWDSNYDGKASTTVNFIRYGGWNECAIKQFRGTSTVGRVPNVDWNITAAR